MRTRLKDSGRYRIVSTDPVQQEVAKGSDLRKCGGCADDHARKLGADVTITGEIQKVSNLILNINIYVKDVGGKAPEKADYFQHGVRYLVKNNLPPAEDAGSGADAPKRDTKG